MAWEDEVSDQEFLAGLRTAVERYFDAVDRWEAAYQKYYRLPGYGAKVSTDLEPEHQHYEQQRRELAALVPRARRLCLKHQLRDAFSGLLRISLGRYAPQQRVDSAIGRSERSQVTRTLMELRAFCEDWDGQGSAPEPDEKPQGSSFLKRLVNYFY